MTSTQPKQDSQHNHGMSNAAVLVIGVVLGLVGAGAFIFFNQKTADTTVTATLPVNTDMPVNTTDSTSTDTAALATPAAGTVTPAASPTAGKEQPQKLTQEDVKEYFRIKQLVDNALMVELNKIKEAMKAADAIPNGKSEMSLTLDQLKDHSVKIKAVIDSEYNFISALNKVENTLIQQAKAASLSESVQKVIVRSYMFDQSLDTSLAVHNANVMRWVATREFIDFLATNFGKWKYDAEKDNTKVLDDSLADPFKSLLTNIKIATTMFNQAQAQHIQVYKQRQAAIQKAQQAAAAQQAATAKPADATATAPAAPAPAPAATTGTPAK